MNKILCALIALALAACSETIEPGEVGVVSDWGQVKTWTYPEGFHFVSPFYDVIHMSTRTQIYAMTAQAAAAAGNAATEASSPINVLTRDQLSVTLSASIQFHLTGATGPSIYRLYGADYADTIVHPIVRTALRDAASEFNATDLVDRRAELQDHMEHLVVSRIADSLRGRRVPASAIVIENILLQDIDLPQALDEAINSVQRQRQQTSQREQALLTARAESDRLATEAQGEAAARRIRSEAEADANRRLTASLTPQVIELRRIEAMQALASGQETRLVFLPTGTGVNLMMSPP